MPPPLDQLSEGALDWLTGNLEYFDPFSASARSSPHMKAKAALELALLCHCWERLDTEDDRLSKAGTLVRTLWPLPAFHELITDQPPYCAPQYGLVYAALAPSGIDDTLCRTTLARLVADGHLTPPGKSPYERLEARFYADKAGVDHEMESYEELVGQSPLVRTCEARPISTEHLTDEDAYAVTHSCFFLSDFGRRDPGLAHDSLTRTAGFVRHMLDHYVRRDSWDLAAEFVITQFSLGSDPLRNPSGLAAIECLAKAQLPGGAIPGRSAAVQASSSDPPGEFFEKAYHTTLVTALMSLIISPVRTSCQPG